MEIKVGMLCPFPKLQRFDFICTGIYYFAKEFIDSAPSSTLRTPDEWNFVDATQQCTKRFLNLLLQVENSSPLKINSFTCRNCFRLEWLLPVLKLKWRKQSNLYEKWFSF